MLHIVNGSAAEQQLRAAGVGGDCLPWDDVLHEGPVPPDLDLKALSEVRARFIHDCGWSSLEAARRRFEERDRRLREGAAEDEVVIWSTFELYDQLHLLQLLDWFEQHRGAVARPSLVFIWDYFSSLAAADIRQELESRVRASDPQCAVASELWRAFRSPDPRELAGWLDRHTSELPFMHKALLRLLEEYPAVRNGLSRTQAQILQILDLGPESPGRLFRASQQLESEAFMGDWSFWRQVALLCNGFKPAVRVLGQHRFRYPTHFGPNDDAFARQVLELTEFGHDVIHEGLDFFAANPATVEIGGVTLDAGNDWRWDAAESRLLPVS